MTGVASTYGPLLFGSAMALVLSGILSVQCIMFFRLYSGERGIKNLSVVMAWIVDLAQSSFILASLGNYFIIHFGDQIILSEIPWPVTLTLFGTAIQTYIAHFFYVTTIYHSSKRNWFITGLIVLLASLHSIATIIATAEMLAFPMSVAFIRSSHDLPSHPDPRVLLSLATGTDLAITVYLCYYLRQIRSLSSSSVMQRVLDTLTIYTAETGLITCLPTIGALACWIAFPNATSVSFTLYIIVGKLYPNSLLFSLNTRKELREMHFPDPETIHDPSGFLADVSTNAAAQHTPTPRMSFINLDTPLMTPSTGYHPTFQTNKVVSISSFHKQQPS
ncbi:hypothetical protein C8J57DRAFT_1713602 [Mycena rebaudengoi]|nr:hypothetical protein C8J57DRAFT_1713602 [Mycena rebaudengoi]